MLNRIFSRRTPPPEHLVAVAIPGQSTKPVQFGGVTAEITGYDSDPYFQNIQAHTDALAPLYKVVNGTCPDDGVIIDVGANIGISGILMSLMNPNGRTICVEPSLRNFQLLEKNTSANVPHAVLMRRAIGAGDGDVSFHESPVCGAWNHVTEGSSATTKVPLTSLDNLVASLGIDRVDFVKIDVEGFETHVLAGMQKTVDEFNPVVHMEINSLTTILEGNRNPRDLLADFIALMGNVYAYGPNDVLEPLTTPDQQKTFIFRNLMERGLIDDVVGCRDASRLAAIL